MKHIVTYCSGISLADIEAMLVEMHMDQLLSEGEGTEKTPQERYEQAFAVNFMRGLIRVVDERIKAETQAREDTEAA